MNRISYPFVRAAIWCSDYSHNYSKEKLKK